MTDGPRLWIALKLLQWAFRIMPDCQKKQDLTVFLRAWATKRDTLEEMARASAARKSKEMLAESLRPEPSEPIPTGGGVGGRKL